MSLGATRITLMTAEEALRAYNRFVDDWPGDSWLVPSFIQWKTHKRVEITGIEPIQGDKTKS